MSTVTRYTATFTTTSINDVRPIQFPTREKDPVGGVDRHSGVFATITEVDKPVGGTSDFPFVGNASLSIRNVAPNDDGRVFIWIAVVPSFFDLNVRVQFLICND